MIRFGLTTAAAPIHTCPAATASFPFPVRPVPYVSTQQPPRRRVRPVAGDMDRILALSLVGAGPGNVFGPGMSAGALESFFARGKAERGNGRGAAGEGAGSAAAAGGGGRKTAAERASEAEAKVAGGQEGRGADSNARLHKALDGMLLFEAVAPH